MPGNGSARERGDLAVVFRVDGSAAIGTGHVMRCLTLADALALRGIASTFVCRSLPDGLAHLLDRAGHALVRLSGDTAPPPASPDLYARWLGTTEEHDAEAFAAATSDLAEAAFAVVADHYALGRAWETIVRRSLGLPIVAIDDLGRAHEADVLVDCTYGKTEADYAGRLPEGCRALTGSDFALLRPDFARERPSALRRRAGRLAGDAGPAELLVSMGGGDPDDVLGFLLGGLLSFSERRGLRVNALVGAAYPHHARLDRLAGTAGGQLRVHRDVTDMASFLARMDVCIGAAGSSAWERCCLGLPTMNVTIAENQRSIACRLAEGDMAADGGEVRRGPDGAVTIDGCDATIWVRDRFVPFASDLEGLRRMSARAAAAVDGFGTMRVVAAMLGCLTPDLPVRLVPAAARHAEILFQWQSFPGMRRHYRNPEPPAWDEHLAWLDRRLASEDRLRIVKYGGIAAGLVRLERTEMSRRLFAGGCGWEISILIAPELQGRGIAARAIALALEEAAGEPVAAWVSADNGPSLRAFARCGFRRAPSGALIYGASESGVEGTFP